MARKNRDGAVSSAVPNAAERGASLGHNNYRQAMNASLIADYFIWKSQGDSRPVTNKKLQKLLYYAQAWSLALNDKKLFSDDIEAWVHGPAIPGIYTTYKEFGFKNIQKVVSEKQLQEIPDADKKLLDEIWRIYGKYDADYLELLSHSEEPWQEARAGLEADKGSSNVIDPDTMRTFYRAKLAK